MIDLKYQNAVDTYRTAFAVITELDDGNLLYGEKVKISFFRLVFERMVRKLNVNDVWINQVAEVMAKILAPLSLECKELKPVVTMLFDFLEQYGEGVRARYSNLRAQILGDRPIIVPAGSLAEEALKGPIRFEGIEPGRKVGSLEE